MKRVLWSAAAVAVSVAAVLVPAGMAQAAASQAGSGAGPLLAKASVSGVTQHYDEVQSACPTVSNYDTTNPAFWSLGVGYDGFGDCLHINGTAYAYYQVQIPSAVWGTHIDSATMQAKEAYSASCTLSAKVTLSQTGAINPSTDWDNAPGVTANLVTVNVPPNTTKVGTVEVNCNTHSDPSPSTWRPVGFTVTSAIQQAATDHSSNITVRLWEQGNPPSAAWKRFSKNPFIQIQYTKPLGSGAAASH